ncbi:MAG: hypothetical protein M3Z13_00195 [Candidatus Dormibacteraeota bacterium]|nr:hypothetical protein [Candidatus Dormibacteraeota bacterium]
MENKIITLRDRSEMVVQRGKRTVYAAAAVGAALAVAVVAAVIIYRVSRPPTRRERLARILPRQVWMTLQQIRDSWELGVRKQVPPMRLFIGDKQVGEEPPSSGVQKIALRLAQAAGTAIGAAVVQRVLQRTSGEKVVKTE